MDMYETASISLGMYTGGLGICLLGFSGHQISMALKNTSGNEEIRSRWNSHRDNIDAVNIWRDESSVCAKINHFLFGKNAESRIKQFAKLKNSVDIEQNL